MSSTDMLVFNAVGGWRWKTKQILITINNLHDEMCFSEI